MKSLVKNVAKKTGKKVIKSVKPKQKQDKKDEKTSKEMPGNMVVSFGKPILLFSFKRVKYMVTIFVCLIIILVLLSIVLFVDAVKARSHIGVFVNMISTGEGEILSSLLAVPVLLFLCLDITIFLFVYKLFAKEKRPKTNFVTFILIMIGLILTFGCFVVMIYILAHIYGKNEHLHDGIIDAMKKYSTNSLYKKQIDRLQIEFQCCGSKKYDEWYNIPWYSASLKKKGSSTKAVGNTPFSCCSMTSMFPCIHHNIESTGRAYLYTPELNLSISTKGCFDRIREKKQQIGWEVIASLILLVFLQVSMLIPVRFIQTAHSESSRFEGNSRPYTVWLIGCSRGKKKENISIEKSTNAPPVPPVPPELRD